MPFRVARESAGGAFAVIVIEVIPPSMPDSDLDHIIAQADTLDEAMVLARQEYEKVKEGGIPATIAWRVVSGGYDGHKDFGLEEG